MGLALSPQDTEEQVRFFSPGIPLPQPDPPTPVFLPQPMCTPLKPAI